MTTKEAYERAKQLAQSGEYEQALATLIGYDHPKIEALRQQIREAAAAKSATVAQVSSKAVAEGIKQARKAEEIEKGKRFGIALILSILIVVGCCSWITYLGTPSLERSIEAVCADALIGMPEGTRCILKQYKQETETCYNRLSMASALNINEWYDCLLEQGVGSNMLDFVD